MTKGHDISSLNKAPQSKHRVQNEKNGFFEKNEPLYITKET